MSSLVINSKIWGEMFGTREMSDIFSDKKTIQYYLEVEAALARVQSRLGIIPKTCGLEISKVAKTDWIDWKLLEKRTSIVGYPILPLVEQLSLKVKKNLGQYCHWGATTQDIMDTADVLQIRDALSILLSDLVGIKKALKKLVKKYIKTPMSGRTHLQHALPTSFGYKSSTWLSGIERHIDRIKEIKERLFYVSFFGAAGTLASLGETNGLRTKNGLAKELKLKSPDVSWHSIRDNFCELSSWISLVGASLGKIAYDVMLMMQTEVQEVNEPFIHGRGSSSTMPQKRNPISSEVILACSKLLREHHSAMLDSMVLDHERATGQWHLEWYTLPKMFIIASSSFRCSRELLEGIQVDQNKMINNLNQTNGLILAESVMMTIAPKLGRQIAHDLVYDCCRKSITDQISLLETLMMDKNISKNFRREEIEFCLNPKNYLGAAPKMVEELLKNVK